MSNLIKSVYFQMDQDDTRVINSDDHVVQFAPELLQQVEASSVNDPEETEPVGEFQQGMNVLNMEDVREEERARVQEETSLEMESMLGTQERRRRRSFRMRESRQMRSVSRHRRKVVMPALSRGRQRRLSTYRRKHSDSRSSLNNSSRN